MSKQKSKIDPRDVMNSLSKPVRKMLKRNSFIKKITITCKNGSKLKFPRHAHGGGIYVSPTAKYMARAANKNLQSVTMHTTNDERLAELVGIKSIDGMTDGSYKTHVDFINLFGAKSIEAAIILTNPRRLYTTVVTTPVTSCEYNRMKKIAAEFSHRFRGENVNKFKFKITLRHIRKHVYVDVDMGDVMRFFAIKEYECPSYPPIEYVTPDKDTYGMDDTLCRFYLKVVVEALYEFVYDKIVKRIQEIGLDLSPSENIVHTVSLLAETMVGSIIKMIYCYKSSEYYMSYPRYNNLDYLWIDVTSPNRLKVEFSLNYSIVDDAGTHCGDYNVYGEAEELEGVCDCSATDHCPMDEGVEFDCETCPAKDSCTNAKLESDEAEESSEGAEETKEEPASEQEKAEE